MEKTISVEKMFKFIEWLHEVNSPKQLNGNNRFKYRPIVLSLSIDPKTDKVVENQLVWKVKDLKGKTTTHSLDDMWEMYLQENVLKSNSMRQKVTAPLGGNAKFIVERTSALGDMRLTVIPNSGKEQSLDILEDHLPYIIQALEKVVGY